MHAINNQPAYQGNIQPLNVIDISQWYDRTPPMRRWLVPGILLKGSVTLFTGDGGVGKSLLMQQLMTACATRQTWLGMPVTPCKTFGLFCEDDSEELWRRQTDINNHYGVSMREASRSITICSRVGRENILMNFEKFSEKGKSTPLYDQVFHQVKESGSKLVIIDTAADTFGGNENIRVHVRQFINALRRFALETDGGVILTAHPSIQGMQSGSGTSGSTAWNNSVRGRFYLTRPKDDEAASNQRTMKICKSNYGGLNQYDLVWHAGVFMQERKPTQGWAGPTDDE